MAVQRMYTVKQAAPLLGMHPNQVRIEIREGRLRAKRTHAPRRASKPGERTRPHYLILESEIKRYQDNLPDALEQEASPATPAPSGGGVALQEPAAKKRKSTKGGADWV